MKRPMCTLLLLALLTFHCKDNTQVNGPSPDSEIIAFSFGYINFAWGYIHNGGFITRTGTMYTFHYNNYALDTIVRIEQDGLLITSEMQTLLQASTINSRTVSSDTMTLMLLLIDKVIPTNISPWTGCGADMGEVYLWGYNKASDSTYTVVDLYERGDRQRRNLTPEAYPLTCYLGSMTGITIDTTSCR
jgi:hypothetical protein